MDRRRLASNGRIALASLRGQVKAERFVEGRPMQVTVPELNLCRDPGGALDKVLLFGEEVAVLDIDGDDAFLQCASDGYVGYAKAASLAGLRATTHRVTARSTHLYPTPSIKTKPRLALSIGSRLAGMNTRGEFLESPEGFVPLRHLAPKETKHDPVETARKLLGTPYLWGGNSATGIDCSGLVQLCHGLAGQACPRDSDQQEAEFGERLEPDASLRAGDLIFWNGHVGMMADALTLIHANVFHMAVAEEPLSEAIARIDRNEFGSVTARKRIPAP